MTLLCGRLNETMSHLVAADSTQKDKEDLSEKVLVEMWILMTHLPHAHLEEVSCRQKDQSLLGQSVKNMWVESGTDRT